MIYNAKFSDIIYKNFKNSPQSYTYDLIFELHFENFVEDDLRTIKKQSNDRKKCFIINGAVEPHWYDHGAMVSRQFQEFLTLLKKHQIFNADFFIPSFGDMYQHDFEIMNNNHDGWNFIRFDMDIPYCTNDVFDIGNDEEDDLHVERICFNFHHMNFTHRMHRQLFSKFILDKKLHKTNCVAINIGSYEDFLNSNSSSLMSGRDGNIGSGCISVDANDYWQFNNNLKKLWRDVELHQVDHPDIDQTPSIKNNFVKKSGVTVISESVFNHPYPYFTEKTVSALMTQRPFVVIGPQGSLNTLRQKGFKTFDDIFDESYDKIKDPSARLEAVFELVEQIHRRSLDQIKENVLQCRDKLNHNKKLMIKRIQTYA